MTDVCVAKLDATGHPAWSRRFGNAGQQFPMAVAIDSSDEIVLAVQSDNPVDFGTGVPDAAAGGGSILKLDASGSVVWVRT
jgi:hypothetical protein